MPTGIYKRKLANPVARFLPKVNKTDTCWLWIGFVDKHGYGRFRFNGKFHGAHRFSYLEFIGPIEDGKVIDHICRIRNCVNPEHLRIITNKENILIGVGFAATNKSKTHCKRGHELSLENIQVYNGSRFCLVCRREQGRIYRESRRDK